MKTLVTILSLISCLQGFARKVYVSNTGSNAYPGTIASPYQTIAKVNTIFSTLLPGDTVFFHRGDSFSGSLVATAAGTAAASIVISAYGTGALPVFTGLVTLHDWAPVAGTARIYKCKPDVALKATCNVLTIGGIPQAVGRTPWMSYQNATGSGGTGTLTSSSLASSPDYTGAEIISRKNGFLSDKARITSQSGSMVNFTTAGYTPLYSNISGLSNGSSGYGFFLQRFAGSLDQNGEWFYDEAAGEMQLYSNVNPNTLVIKASAVDAIIELGNRNNITIENIDIEGASTYGVHAFNNLNLKVKNCLFRNNTIAIYFGNSMDLEVRNCDIDYSLSCAIFLGGNTGTVKRLNVIDNRVNHTGEMPGMGIFNKDFCLRAIVAFADVSPVNNFTNVIGNVVKNTGNGAIQFQGSNVIIRRNVSDSFCTVLDDNGGIYTFINNQTPNTVFFTNRLIDSNFISNAIGAPLGAPPGHLDVVGLYLDDQTCNVTAIHNTIYNIPGPGIQLNTPLNVSMWDNTVYNTSYSVFVNKKAAGNINGLDMSSNTFYQQKPTQYIWYYTHFDLSSSSTTITKALSSFAHADSNYISNLKPQGFGFYYSATPSSGNTFPSPVTLEQWKGTYNHSRNSRLPAAAVTATNTRIEINPADGNKIVVFPGLSKVDPKGNVYNNSATIPPWSSLVLVDNGKAPINIYPDVSAGRDQSIQSPADSLTLTGSADDSDGHIIAMDWLQLDGPAAADIIDADSAITVVKKLVVGRYHFQLTVTDNSGAQSSSTMAVTVIPAKPRILVPPGVEAGPNRRILQPKDTVHLVGSSPDTDIVNRVWTRYSAPVGATDSIENSAAYATTISGLTVEGVYLYKLTLIDSDGLSASDFVQVTVRSVPKSEQALIRGWIFIDQ